MGSQEIFDAESDQSCSDTNIDASSIGGIIRVIEDNATITRQLCVNTEGNSRAIGDISDLVHSLSERMDRIETTARQLASTMDEILRCERTALEKFRKIAGELERPVATRIDFGRRSS